MAFAINRISQMTRRVPNPQGAYMAADNLWHDWNEQGPTNQDADDSDPRDALFAGSNFLGTYSTGMLRVGFLFE